MPRPHMPHHISLQRIRSAGSSHNNQNGHSPQPNSAPPTPPAGSRSGSPTRGSVGSNAPKSPSEGRTGDHKGMGLMLRVQVLKARNLAPKDKSGTSDPFLVLNIGDEKEATSVVNKTLNPEWNQTFEFPVLTADAALLEVICWDKDRFKKDYMGEFDVVLEELFQGGAAMPAERWMKLESRRGGRKRKTKKKNADVTGEVLLKFTLYDPVNTAATPQQVLQKFYGVVGANADDDDEDDELLGRTGSHSLDDVSEEDDDDDDDDEEEEDEEEKEPSDETDDGTHTPSGTTTNKKAKRRRMKKIRKLRRKTKMKAYEFSGMSDVAGVLFLEINRITDLPPEKNSTRTTFDMDPFIVTSLGKRTYRTKVVSHNLNPVYDEKLVFQVQKHEVNYSLNFAVVDRDKFSGNDFVGTATFPIDKVSSLAPEADPETGLYNLPDPEAVMEGEQGGRRKRWRLPMSRSTSQNNLSRNSSSGNLTKLTRTTSSNSLRGDQLPATSSHSSQRPGMRRMESESDVLEQLSASHDNGGNQRPAPTSAPSYTPALSQEPGSNGGGASQRPPPTSAPSYTSVLSNEPGQNGGGPSEDPDLFSFVLPLELKNKQRWQDKHSPTLYVRAKYLPYRALRQQFWRAMLRQYDADESGKIDKVELLTMLDTLGSTLHNSTIERFFTRWRRTNEASGLVKKGEKVLTMDQVVICLEEQLINSRETQARLHRPHWERGESTASTTVDNSSPDYSPGATTPYLGGQDVDTAGNARPPVVGSGNMLNTNVSSIPQLEVSDLSGNESAGPKRPEVPGTPISDPTSPSNLLSRQDSWGAESEADLNDDPSETKEEHVVEIQECPICHMPRLSSRGRKGRRRGTTDADIITHIATCASSDWRAVNNLVMAGFVTSSQAQRKWYSKVVTKISYGGYRLGANSANILVQDRLTGMINEERMSVYVRLGIRLLYKGLKSRDMEAKRSMFLNDVQGAIAWFSRRSTSAAHSVTSVRKLLRSLSFKQGRKYDDPASASQIPGFVNFHQLDMSEVLLSTGEFKTFNEFFYRKLKADARPCSAPDNPHIIVSPADCRSVVFNRMEDAQRIWVKGREFSIERLLGDAYPQDAKRYKNGALGVFRLAPQDYHRFHIPVDGIMGEPKLIDGEYYTVNPMAIRSALDVYGENIRVIVPIDTVAHGRVIVVCVGAMMVGSTIITRKAGEQVKRAEELGYFKFGGSTLLVLFEPGVMKFDEDMATNSNDALETLIRVGMSIGHSPHQAPYRPDMQKANPTQAEKDEAKRRIEGSFAPSKGGDPVGKGMSF